MFPQLQWHDFVPFPGSPYPLETEDYTAPFTEGGEFTPLAYTMLPSNIIRFTAGIDGERQYKTAIPLENRALNAYTLLTLGLETLRQYPSTAPLDAAKASLRLFRGTPAVRCPLPVLGSTEPLVEYIFKQLQPHFPANPTTLESLCILKAGRIVWYTLLHIWPSFSSPACSGKVIKLYEGLRMWAEVSQEKIINAPLETTLAILRLTHLLCEPARPSLSSEQIELYPEALG